MFLSSIVVFKASSTFQRNVSIIGRQMWKLCWLVLLFPHAAPPRDQSGTFSTGAWVPLKCKQLEARKKGAIGQLHTCHWNKTIKIVCKYLFYMLVTRKEKHLGNETMKQWYETIQNVAINQIKIECFTGAWEDRKATENLSIVWASLLNTNACGGSWGCSSSVATLPFWPPTWETQAKQWRFEHLVSHQRARVSHSRGKRSQRGLLRIHHS